MRIYSKHMVLAAAMAATGVPSTLSAVKAQQGFETMAQPREEQLECKAPRPPRDLAETAYIRNGYRAIMRIMAVEKWQETGSCECFVTQIGWDEVVIASESFVTSDNPRLPFDVVMLDKRATEMEAERITVCAAE